MTKLNIFNSAPKYYNKKDYNLIWCLNKSHKKLKKNFLPILNLKKYNTTKIKKKIKNELKNFFFIKIKNKNIANYFKIKNDFSACILSNLVEKNPYLNNLLQDFVRVKLTQKFIKQKKITTLVVSKANYLFKNKLDNYFNSKNIKNKNYQYIIYYFTKNFSLFLKSAIKNMTLSNNQNQIKNQKQFF